jgi:hypothetical protein
LGVGIGALLVVGEHVRDRIVEGGQIVDALGAAEAGFYRPLVLIDCVDPGDEVAHEEPDNEAEDATEDDGHGNGLNY